MARRGWSGGVAGVVVLAWVTAFAAETHRPAFHRDEDDMPEFSASRLGDPMDEGSVADFLTPEEREAVRHSGMAEDVDLDAHDAAAAPPREPDAPKGAFARAADKAGKVGVVMLGLGMTFGAMVAPLFLAF